MAHLVFGFRFSSARVVAGWFFAVAALGTGCLATTKAVIPGKPIVEFPSRQALTEIESRPAALPSLTAGEIPVEGWTMEASYAARAPEEPWAPSGSWETAFATDVAEWTPRPHATRALSCAARELGRFILQTGAPPPERVRQFMMGACGSVAPLSGFHPLKGDAPDRVIVDFGFREARRPRASLLPSRFIGAGCENS